jgi:predicted transglutaminase-like cysteine proteinase
MLYELGAGDRHIAADAMRQPLCGKVNARVQFRIIVGLASCVIILGTIGAAAQAKTLVAPWQSAAAGQSGAAQPTLGWANFCQRFPRECAIDLSEPAAIELTPEAWQIIVRVNRDVNGAIKAVTDKEHWGVVDRWDFAEDGYGDCEDYELLKRKRLVEAGFPHRAMRMTVVIDENGQGHAVMMVRTDRGDFILDNKRSEVLPWRQTGYTYVKREGDESSAWTSLGRIVASPATTAGR